MENNLYVHLKRGFAFDRKHYETEKQIREEKL